MRCEFTRSLGRRFPRFGAFLIRKHLLRCRRCRDEMALDIREDAFFRAENFENEDLWPAVSERIGAPQSARQARSGKAEVHRMRPVRRPVIRFRPSFAGAALLILAAVAAASYFGVRAFWPVPGRDSGSDLLTAGLSDPSETEILPASIDAAFVQGRAARVFIYVQPKNSTMSFFWLEPLKDSGNENPSKGATI